MESIEKINYGHKEIYLIKTAHVSKNSVDDVNRTIEEVRPDAICIELDSERMDTLNNQDRWRNTDITEVIKNKMVGYLLVSVILSSFQKRMAAKMDTTSGGEMAAGIAKSRELGCELVLADRNIKTTFARIWHSLGFWEKGKLLSAIIMSIFDDEDISEEDIAKLKETDMLDVAMAEVAKNFPTVKKILVDERDMYLSSMIKNAKGGKIVAIIGAAHAKGIKNHIDEDIDIAKLNQIPEKKGLAAAIKWILPLAIIIIIIASLFINADVGLDQIKSWLLWTGSLSALGAIIAFSHPLTIAVAFIVAPLTTLHPLLASGWFAGLCEAWIRKPRVKDFEDLAKDTDSLKGFWHNRVTHILLVVVLTNLTASIGSILAGIDIIKSFLGII